MIRLASSVMLGGAMALALAGPVLGWSGIDVTVSRSGPAIGGTGEVLVPQLLTSPVVARPTGSLGARFEISYREGAGGPIVATQDLYPYAVGGPVAYTAAGGTIVGHPFAAGWHRADASVLRLLVSWGLPETPTAASAVGQQAAGAEAAEHPVNASLQPGWLGLILAAGLALTGIIVWTLLAARRADGPDHGRARAGATTDAP